MIPTVKQALDPRRKRSNPWPLTTNLPALPSSQPQSLEESGSSETPAALHVATLALSLSPTGIIKALIDSQEKASLKKEKGVPSRSWQDRQGRV